MRGTRTLGLGLVTLVAVAGAEREAQGREWYYPDGVGVTAGFAMLLLEDTPFGALAEGYGLDVLGVGPALSVSYDRRVRPWLAVGGTLALRMSEGERSALTAGIRGGVVPASEAALYLATPRAFVRLSYYEADGDEGALEMGIEAAVGGGVTLFAWRDEVDAAAHFEVGGAMLWALHLGCWAASLRIEHALMWQEGLGPLDVGWAGAWIPTVAVRVEKRW